MFGNLLVGIYLLEYPSFPFERVAALFVTGMLFISVVTLSRARRLLANKFFIYFGGISYAFYLFHNLLGLELLNETYVTASWIPAPAMRVVPLILISCLAIVLTKAESKLRHPLVFAETRIIEFLRTRK